MEKRGSQIVSSPRKLHVVRWDFWMFYMGGIDAEPDGERRLDFDDHLSSLGLQSRDETTTKDM